MDDKVDPKDRSLGGAVFWARPDSPAVGQPLTPAQAMRLAIEEGAKGAGFVSPNPLVGCTIVDRDHRFLAVGYHHKVGEDHAEVDAIKKAQLNPELAAKLEGAHYYVTLEPCAHQGRTPPCTKALIRAKAASVTFAITDPNPQVTGKGAEALNGGGVRARSITERDDIRAGERVELIEEAEDLAEVFLHNMRAQEPFIAVKVASTLDGKIATTMGESKWITGKQAREHSHLVRLRYDAIAIGRATFIADNPSLNVRHPQVHSFQNSAMILDPEGRTLAGLSQSNLFKVRGANKVFIVVDEKANVRNDFGVRIVKVPTEKGVFRVPELLAALKSEGLNSILIEGGAHAISGFFAAEKVQRLHLYLAPTILGGLHGLSWSSQFGKETMGERIHLERSNRLEVGDDLYWTARVRFSN